MSENEPITTRKHLFHNVLREATENGGYAVRTMGKSSRHKKTGALLVNVVGYSSGVEQVVWCENENIAQMWESVPDGLAVNIKAYGAKDRAYVKLFDVNGNDVTPEPTVPGGFTPNAAPVAGGFGAQPAEDPLPLSQPEPAPWDEPSAPPPNLMAPPSTPPVRAAASSDTQKMEKAFEDAGMIVRLVAHANPDMPPSFEDLRAVAISLFIHRT